VYPIIVFTTAIWHRKAQPGEGSEDEFLHKNEKSKAASGAALYKRNAVTKITMGMVGEGEGAFIGAVHRMAAALGGEIELVCGAFSSNAERAARSGAALATRACLCRLPGDAGSGGSVVRCPADAVCAHFHTQLPAFSLSTGRFARGISRCQRQARHL
jgi:hypothetical protein